MRSLYETQDNLNLEREIAMTLGQMTNTTPAKLPIAYRLDYAFHDSRNSVRWLAEIKVRQVKYDTLIISAHKIESARSLSLTMLVPVVLVVKWPNEAAVFHRITQDTLRRATVTVGGRTDRGDWQDVEPVLHIDVSQFSPLHQLNSIITNVAHVATPST